ncbi:MAG: chorismate mutase, partial [Candidatus Binatia bacterium]
SGAFDVGMSGITWRPERAVVGWMTRAVARGGPCVVGDGGAKRVGVNRGGVLETFARTRFRAAEIVAVDDNLSLPSRLGRGELGAAVTDSFELVRFSSLGLPSRCEPPHDRKVYWVSPATAAELGPRIDDWLERNEPRIDALRVEWLGGSQPRDEIDHLIDLLARRLQLMPAVAAYKHAHGLTIEDREREVVVLARAEERARIAALDPASVRRFFAVQIELAKSLERRSPPADATLDLDRDLRPALGRIGDQIVTSLAIVAPLDAAMLFTDRLVPLAMVLEEMEMERLRRALLEVDRSGATSAAEHSR